IPYHFELRKYAENGVAVVGDAAGVTNPRNGGGIHPALWSGRVAGELASQGRLDEYDAILREAPILDAHLYETAKRSRRWDEGVLKCAGDLLAGVHRTRLPVLEVIRR